MDKTLTRLCETRWVERHDGVLQFRLLLPKIIAAVDHIASWDDVKTAAKAQALKFSLSDGEFILAVVCLSQVLSCTLPLSQFLQKTQIDVKTARKTIQDTMAVLQRKRDDSENTFSSIFIEASNLAKELDSEIKMPRTANRQTNRCNDPTDDCEKYYRLGMYIPLLDNIIADFQVRFSEDTVNLFSFSVLFPHSTTYRDGKMRKAAVRQLAERYCEYFNDSASAVEAKLTAEFNLWEAKWQREHYDESCRALDLLNMCDKNVYVTLHVLLRIFVTVPISGASGERSFSCLRRIKTWLRTTTTDERLTGLAVMSVNYGIVPRIERVIDRYAAKGKHRKEFIV